MADFDINQYQATKNSLNGCAVTCQPATANAPSCANPNPSGFDINKYNQVKTEQSNPQVNESLIGTGAASATPQTPAASPATPDEIQKYNDALLEQTAESGYPFPQAPLTQEQANDIKQGEEKANATAQQTQQALGAKYEPDKLPGLQRLQLGMAPDFDLQQKKFFSWYPKSKGSEFDQVTGPNGEQFIKYKFNDKDQPALLSPGSVAAWNEWQQSANPENPPEVRGKAFINAVFHTLENNPVESAEAVTLAAIAPEAGTLRSAIGVPVAFREAATSYFSPQMTSLDDAFHHYLNSTTQAAWDSANVLGSYLLTAGALSGYNLYKGYGILPRTEAGNEAIDALKRLKDKMLTVGMDPNIVGKMNFIPSQVASSRILKNATALASRLIDTIPAYVTKQRELGAQFLKKSYNPQDVEAGLQSSDNIVPSKSGTIPSAIEGTKETATLNGPPNPNVNFTQAMGQINNDFGNYAKNSQGEVTAAYNRARAIEEPQFDPTPALDAAYKADAGVKLATRNPVTGTIEGQTINPPQPDLQKAIDLIKQWGTNPPRAITQTLPNGQVIEHNVVDQINALRQQVWGMTQADPKTGAVRADAATARDIYNGLTQMMENTRNQNPAFNAAWKNASAMARQRFENLENPLLARGYRQNEGDMLTTGTSSGKTLMGESGRQIENLQQLKDMADRGVIRPQSYASLLQAEKTKLLSNPYTVSDTIDKMDDEYKNLLFNGDTAEINSYKQFGNIFKEIKNSGIEDSVANNRRAVDMIEQLVNTGQTNGNTYAMLKHIATDNPNSGAGQTIRAGVLNKLFLDAIRVDKTNYALDQNTFDSFMRNAAPENKDLMQFLQPEDIQHLKDLQLYLHTIEEGASSLGAGIVGMQQTSRLQSLEKEALKELAVDWSMGRVLTNPSFHKIMYGTNGFNPIKGNLLKSLSLILGASGPQRSIDISSKPVNEQTDDILKNGTK